VAEPTEAELMRLAADLPMGRLWSLLPEMPDEASGDPPPPLPTDPVRLALFLRGHFTAIPPVPGMLPEMIDEIVAGKMLPLFLSAAASTRGPTNNEAHEFSEAELYQLGAGFARERGTDKTPLGRGSAHRLWHKEGRQPALELRHFPSHPTRTGRPRGARTLSGTFRRKKSDGAKTEKSKSPTA
jgi:hypothetical protein